MDVKGGQGATGFSLEIEGVAGPDNKTNKFDEYVNEVRIMEGIDSPAIRAIIAFDDSGDVISRLAGGETFFLTLENDVSGKKVEYNLQLYKITDRVRFEKRNVYNLHLCSEEFLRNELVNVFGSFQGKKTDDYVGEYLGSDYINTDKELYAEATDEKFSYVCPNWRPFNAINYLAEKSLRKKQTGKLRQSGYIFYENLSGYHYITIDAMIEDANKQTPKGEKKGTGKRPLPQLYYYGYSQANLPSMAEETKDFIIQSISFPKSYNLLENLRHGTWAGYTQGFDPVDLAKSSSGDQSGDLPLALDEYTIRGKWKDMSHVNPKGKPPFDMSKLAPQGEPSLVDTPRRVRLKPVMTRGYGNMEKKESKQSAPIGGQSVKSIVEAASYNFLRLKSLLYQQLQISVPGNLDLMAGHGIHITIPKALPDNPNSTNIPTDQRWSGLWIIASTEHKYHDGRMVSILLLTRDSTPDSGGASSKNNESTATIAGNASGRRKRKGRVRKKRRGLRRRGASPIVGSGLGSRKKRRRRSKKRGKNVSNLERRTRRNKKRSTAGRRAIRRTDRTARRANRGGRKGSGGTRTKKMNSKKNKRRNRRRKNKNR
ncbi:hypothetical protein Sn110110_013 [Cyanophage S-RIM14]|uniref:Uncharacterized protein n=1 Tax=Cyanophage S-RIM14 TaxID=1278423 RepID=A0A1D7SKT3_9CAUD|nr:hypothetical protein Sn110110_013 [Cyanophage S-RIM14]